MLVALVMTKKTLKNLVCIFGHIISLLNLNGNILIDLVIGETSEAQYPIQFQNMSNEFEVALWVAQHPRILNLAKEIQNAKLTSVISTNQVLSAPISSDTTPPEVDQVI